MSEARKRVNRNKHRGRKYQTTVAKIFGGHNIGTLGGEDVKHDIFSIEAKSYENFIGHDWLEEAESEIYFDNLIPVIKWSSKASEDELILIRIGNFLKIKSFKFYLIIKHTKRFKGMTFMSQAIKNCPFKKIPLVVCHKVGKRHISDIVIVNYSDFKNMTKKFNRKS